MENQSVMMRKVEERVQRKNISRVSSDDSMSNSSKSGCSHLKRTQNDEKHWDFLVYITLYIYIYVCACLSMYTYTNIRSFNVKFLQLQLMFVWSTFCVPRYCR